MEENVQDAEGFLDGDEDVTLGFNAESATTDLAFTRNKLQGAEGNTIALGKGFFKNKRSVNGAKGILNEDIQRYDVAKRAGKENNFGTLQSPGKKFVFSLIILQLTDAWL